MLAAPGVSLPPGLLGALVEVRSTCTYTSSCAHTDLELAHPPSVPLDHQNPGKGPDFLYTLLPWVVGAKLGLKRAVGDVPDLSFPAKQVKVKFVSANCVPGVLSWG